MYICNMEKTELVIIGDVIKSRNKFISTEWENFHQSIIDLNKDFSNALKIPFTIYSGDSFGAVCKDLITAVEIILAIQEYQQPYMSRTVLIEDNITYGIDNKNFLTLEGPALWKSQAMLNFLKKNKMLFESDLQNQLMAISINTLINMVLSFKMDWDKKIWTIYKKYKSGVRQKDIAKELKISQQYVSKVINKYHIKLIKSTEDNLKDIINGIGNCIHRNQ